MGILVWVLQIFLAVHTAIGAIWKFSNSEQMVPSLSAIPHPVWMALIGVEFLLALCLLLPIFNRRFFTLAIVGALGVAAEMLFFVGVHVLSGDQNSGPVIYWLVVAAFSIVIALVRKFSKTKIVQKPDTQ